MVKAVKGVRILFQFLEMGYESFPHNTTAYTLKTEGKTDSTLPFILTDYISSKRDRAWQWGLFEFIQPGCICIN